MSSMLKRKGKFLGVPNALLFFQLFLAVCMLQPIIMICTHTRQICEWIMKNALGAPKTLGGHLMMQNFP